ncbi:hypothetical protein [Microvirus mar31]|uniref:Uncharacterized protein n=1 Tax=Microvirus mar31 TaxID=2851165 RepID=A0A8F5RC14_9VIRU|nr:hypothetical protein [Microvirus mar31]
MMVYTKGKPGKLSVVVVNATAQELSLVRSVLAGVDDGGVKFLRIEEKLK